MPAQLLQATDVDLAGAVKAERRRLPGLARRVCRIAAQAGHSDHRVVLLVVRLQVPVGQRPVVGNAIEALDAEIRGTKARKVPAPVDRATPDGIEHERDNGRPVHVDGIVFRALAYIRVLGKIGRPVMLPIGPVMGIRLRVHPAALLQADDRQPGLRQRPRHRRARRPRTDDEHIRHTILRRQHRPPPDSPSVSRTVRFRYKHSRRMPGPATALAVSKLQRYTLNCQRRSSPYGSWLKAAHKHSLSMHSRYKVRVLVVCTAAYVYSRRVVPCPRRRTALSD